MRSRTDIRKGGTHFGSSPNKRKGTSTKRCRPRSPETGRTSIANETPSHGRHRLSLTDRGHGRKKTYPSPVRFAADMSIPRFVVFEGLDGAGTTTQSFLLAKALRRRGIPTEVTQEPTSGHFGAALRQIVEGRLTVDPLTLAKGFAADRSDHLHNESNGIEKALASGSFVICDRYLLSSLDYPNRRSVCFAD